MSRCPRCGRPVPESADARGSLCPACLMQTALEPTPVELGPPCRVLSVIGRSARATTFLAEGEDGSSLPRFVALKIFDETAAMPDAAGRLQPVQRKAAGFTHPVFARLFEAGLTPEGRPYFVYEYVRGLPILLHCEHFGLDRAARMAMVSAVGAALVAAHRAGLAHGALRAANVIVSTPGGIDAIRMLDLGEAEAIAAIRADVTPPSTERDLEDLEGLRQELAAI